MATAVRRKRPFRTPASYAFEKIARDAVVPFLEVHGVTVLKDERRKVGSGESQIISATIPGGSKVRMRVRLCWRRDGRNPSEDKYAALQLRSRTIDGDWTKTLLHIAERDEAESITHTQAIQCDHNHVVLAALIPSSQIPSIWKRQREISDRLIKQGRMENMHKNHAENGTSPTLWLQDTRTPAAHAVPDVLWGWPSVINLMEWTSNPLDDTLDDLAQSGSEYGSDNPERKSSQRSFIKRNPKVREAVRKRANGACEREGCNARRDFSGFLDVHHILGAATSDRVENCVALCPNCHREAHYSPEADQINAQLLAFAQAFNPARTARRVGSVRRAEPA